jgi:transcriptional regulator with XRE-family HTH domain
MILKDPTNIVYYMRRRFNLTQKQISKKTNLTQNDISRMERGNFSHGMEKFLTLSHFFDIPLEALLFNNIKLIFNTFKAPPKVEHKLSQYYATLREKQEITGLNGEDWVYQLELEKLKETDYRHAVNPNYADDVDAHFDILSFEYDGTHILIEVKTTTGDVDEAFYCSVDELKKAKECLKNGSRYEIHRVFRMNERKKRGRHIIPADNLFSDYEFIPVTYKVVKRRRPNYERC